MPNYCRYVLARGGQITEGLNNPLLCAPLPGACPSDKASSASPYIRHATPRAPDSALCPQAGDRGAPPLPRPSLLELNWAWDADVFVVDVQE